MDKPESNSPAALFLLDLQEKTHTRNWAATFDRRNLPSNRAVPIVIDHFEYMAEAPQSNEQKLLFLEKLVFVEKRKVLIISALNPISYFSNGGLDDPGDIRARKEREEPQAVQNFNRWLSVLRPFQELDFRVADTTNFAQTCSNFKEKLSMPDERVRQKLVELFRGECGPTLRLRQIGEEFVHNLDNKTELTCEQLLNEIAIRAEAYYRALWATCSKTEKLLLVQLAQEGLVNPKNLAAIWQLCRKGLILTAPFPRVMNESFRQFAASALPHETVTAWEREGVPMSWGNLKAVSFTLALGATVFLFLTRQDLFETWTAYATGLVAAIPAVIHLFDAFRTGSPQYK